MPTLDFHDIFLSNLGGGREGETEKKICFVSKCRIFSSKSFGSVFFPSILGGPYLLLQQVFFAYLLKCSLILSSLMFSGRLPTQRCLVSRTIAQLSSARPDRRRRRRLTPAGAPPRIGTRDTFSAVAAAAAAAAAAVGAS